VQTLEQIGPGRKAKGVQTPARFSSSGSRAHEAIILHILRAFLKNNNLREYFCMSCLIHLLVLPTQGQQHQQGKQEMWLEEFAGLGS
jgi:hypothetical protein